MSVYSTLDISRKDAIEIIKDRLENNLHDLSSRRIIEILESVVQNRDYDEYYDRDFCFNNFSIIP